MKVRLILTVLIGIFLLSCESPTSPKKTSFWKYSGHVNEDGNRKGLEISSMVAEENFALLGTLDYGLIVLKDYKLYYNKFVQDPIWALAGSLDKNFWAGTDGTFQDGIQIGRGPRVWEGAGLEGRDVFSIAVHPYTTFAGTDKGLFATQDYGKTWIPRNNDKLMSSAITAMLVSQRNVFAGTDNGDLFFSDNVGDSWIETDFNVNSRINVISSANGNMLIGADSGIYISEDDGQTWTKSFNSQANDFAAHDERVYAGTENGIYVSDNYGNTWTAFETDGLEDFSITALAVTQDGHLLAGTASKGLFRTTDPVE